MKCLGLRCQATSEIPVSESLGEEVSELLLSSDTLLLKFLICGIQSPWTVKFLSESLTRTGVTVILVNFDPILPFAFLATFLYLGI